jgi:hypothetical protein
MFDCVGFSFDLHNCDHVKVLELLSSFCFKLPGIRVILPNLIVDQIKQVFDQVKLRTRSHQASPGTSLLRLHQVVLGRRHNRTERGSAGSTATNTPAD